MAKNERKRTMVYSNVNKKNKADKKSASKDNDIIDLDDEIIIGLTKFIEPKYEQDKDKNKIKSKEKNKVNKENSKVNKENSTVIQKEKTVDKNKKIVEEDDGKNIEDKLIKQNNKNNQNKSQKQNHQNKIQKTNNQTTKKVITKKSIRKKIIIKKLTTCLFLVMLLIGGLTYFLLSPVFNIKTIEVINNQNIPQEQIKNASGIVLNENMFKMSAKEVKNKLLQNPYIESVKVKRKMFDKIQLDITERNATLMLEYGNSYVYINNQGYILEISTEVIQAPILIGYQTPLEQIKPGNRLGKEDLERLSTVLNIMESLNTNNISDLVTKIDIKSKKNYKLLLENEGKTVHLGECTDLSTQMLYIKEMIQREKGIEGDFFVDMDLNISNPVFREKV